MASASATTSTPTSATPTATVTSDQEQEINVVDLDEPPSFQLINDYGSFQCALGESDEDDDESFMHPLENAEAVTGEELASIIISKTVKLRELYEDQMEDLKEIYNEKRAHYLRAKLALKRSRIPFTSNPNLLTKDSKNGITEEFIKQQQGLYKDKKKLLFYLKNTGNRALLHNEAVQSFQDVEKKTGDEASFNQDYKNANSDYEIEELHGYEDMDRGFLELTKEVNQLKTAQRKPVSDIKKTCMFPESKDPYSRKCQETALPKSSYCFTHILEDPKQVLFNHCDKTAGTASFCDTPVLTIVDKLGCPLHYLPAIRDFGETEQAKAEFKEKVNALPPLRGPKKIETLEKLVTSETTKNRMNRMLFRLKRKRLDKKDTDDSEEEEDDMVGIVPGPGYMGVPF